MGRLLLKTLGISNIGIRAVSLRCPACRHVGTFEGAGTIPDLFTSDHSLGHRICPNPQCRTHVFSVLDKTGNVVTTYPPERIDFDPTNIPPSIVKTLEEALACHSDGLHVAAAIMIRRTLEELCEDKKATGANLFERIKALKASVVLPPPLLDALDGLRLLGNDAAHIEAKTYADIGKAELEVAIDITKEILKGVYQMNDLLSRLNALKKP